MVMVQNPDFIPRVEWACRTGLAVALMSVIALAPGSRGSLAIPGFGAFVAVMTTERTLGKTTLNVVGCVKCGSFASLGAALFQLSIFSLPAPARVLLSHCALAAGAYAVARLPLPAMARKLGLSLLPLILIVQLQGSGLEDDGTEAAEDGVFALDLLATTLVGCCCAVGAGLVPWPALAVLRLSEKRAATAALLAELLAALAAAFVAAAILPPRGGGDGAGCCFPPADEEEEEACTTDTSTSTPASPSSPLPSPTQLQRRQLNTLQGSASASKVKRRQLLRMLTFETGAMRELRGQASWNPLLGLFTPVLLPLLLKEKPVRNAHDALALVDDGNNQQDKPGDDEGTCGALFQCGGRRRLADPTPAPTTPTLWCRGGNEAWSFELKSTDSRLHLIDTAKRSLFVMEEAIALVAANDKTGTTREGGGGGGERSPPHLTHKQVLRHFLSRVRKPLLDLVSAGNAVGNAGVATSLQQHDRATVAQGGDGAVTGRGARLAIVVEVPSSPSSSSSAEAEGEARRRGGGGVAGDVLNVLPTPGDDEKDEAREEKRAREAWTAFDESYLAARRDVYYPPDPQLASPLTAESLLPLNAFIFNLRCIGRAVLADAKQQRISQPPPPRRLSSSSSSSSPPEVSRTGGTGTSSGGGEEEEGEGGGSRKESASSHLPPLSACLSSTRKLACLVLCDPATSKGATPLESFKIAFAMACAGVIDHALLARRVRSQNNHDDEQQQEPAVSLTAFTVAYLCLSSDGTSGTSFDTSKQRAEGTLAGAGFAAVCFGLGLASLQSQEEEEGGSGGGAQGAGGQWWGDAVAASLLVGFVVLASYVRGSQSHSYAGTVAAFTASVLMLVPPPPSPSPRDEHVENGAYDDDGGGSDSYSSASAAATRLALGRLEQTLLGIAVWLVVEFTIFPVHASAAARKACVSALEGVSDAVEAVRAHDLAALDAAYDATATTTATMAATATTTTTTTTTTTEGPSQAEASRSSKEEETKSADDERTREWEMLGNPLGLFSSDIPDASTNSSSSSSSTAPADGANSASATTASATPNPFDPAASSFSSAPPSASSTNDSPSLLPLERGTAKAVDGAITAASARVSRAKKLVEAARREPELWRAPFPDTYVSTVLDHAEATLAHVTTAHRALVAATGAAVASFSLAFPDDDSGFSRQQQQQQQQPTNSWIRRAMSDGDAAYYKKTVPSSSSSPPPGGGAPERQRNNVRCCFLLDPLRPSLRLALGHVASSAKAVAAAASEILGDDDDAQQQPSWRSQQEPEATTLPQTINHFFQEYDGLCRGLQPAFYSSRSASSVSGGTDSSSSSSSSGGGGDFEIMSNFEVMCVNALVFSVLQLGREDSTNLNEAVEELLERHRYYAK